MFEKEALAAAAARFSSKNIELNAKLEEVTQFTKQLATENVGLHAMLAEVNAEITHAMQVDNPAEVLESLQRKVRTKLKEIESNKSA
jgi:hypothetical protein